jgi:hypothetical protein
MWGGRRLSAALEEGNLGRKPGNQELGMAADGKLIMIFHAKGLVEAHK